MALQLNVHSMGLEISQQSPAELEAGPISTDAAKFLKSKDFCNLIMSFAPIKTRDMLKGVSKGFHDSAKFAERNELRKYFPQIHELFYDKKVDLEKIKVRNFGAPIQHPLTNFPDRMIGWEQIRPDIWRVYVLVRWRTETSSFSDCPGRTIRIQTELYNFDKEKGFSVRAHDVTEPCCRPVYALECPCSQATYCFFAERPVCFDLLAFIFGCTSSYSYSYQN